MKKMKKDLLIILLLIFFVAISTISIVQAASATINKIYLKDGTAIECDMGWIEGGKFYYRKYGGTIGISLKTVDVDKTYKKYREKEIEAKRGTVTRQVEEEADRNISVSRPIDIPKKSYSEICKSWIGHNINSLVDKWGYPTRNFKAPNGNEVYVYDKIRTIRFPARKALKAPPIVSGEMTKWVLESYAFESPAREYHSGGKAFFETDRSGKIIKARWERKFERIK